MRVVVSGQANGMKMGLSCSKRSSNVRDR